MDTIVVYYFNEKLYTAKLDIFQHFCNKAAVKVCLPPNLGSIGGLLEIGVPQIMCNARIT